MEGGGNCLITHVEHIPITMYYKITRLQVSSQQCTTHRRQVQHTSQCAHTPFTLLLVQVPVVHLLLKLLACRCS